MRSKPISPTHSPTHVPCPADGGQTNQTSTCFLVFPISVPRFPQGSFTTTQAATTYASCSPELSLSKARKRKRCLPFGSWFFGSRNFLCPQLRNRHFVQTAQVPLPIAQVPVPEAQEALNLSALERTPISQLAAGTQLTTFDVEQNPSTLALNFLLPLPSDDKSKICISSLNRYT